MFFVALVFGSGEMRERIWGNRDDEREEDQEVNGREDFLSLFLASCSCLFLARRNQAWSAESG